MDVAFLTHKEQWVVFWILFLLMVGYGVKHYRLSHPPERSETELAP
jgi:hypothetical protein